MGEDEDRSPPVKKFRGNSFVISHFGGESIAVCRLQKTIGELQSSLHLLSGNVAKKFLPIDGKTFFKAFLNDISNDPFSQLCHKETFLNDEERKKVLMWIFGITHMCRQYCAAKERCLLLYID